MLTHNLQNHFLVYKPQVFNELSCFYWDGYGHPYLILQPYKAELLYNSPNIVRFYDVLSNEEIDILTGIGEPQLKWATVQDPATGKEWFKFLNFVFSFFFS